MVPHPGLAGQLPPQLDALVEVKRQGAGVAAVARRRDPVVEEARAGEQPLRVQAVEVLLLAGVVAKGGPAHREARRADPIAGAQGQGEAVEQPQRLEVGVGPKQDGAPQGAEQGLDRRGAAGERTVGGQGGEESGGGGADWPPPGPFAVTVAPFPDQENGEHLGVGELVLARTPAGATRIQSSMRQ